MMTYDVMMIMIERFLFYGLRENALLEVLSEWVMERFVCPSAVFECILDTLLS